MENRIDKIRKEDTLPQTAEERFELFWQSYPKKKSKGDAEKAFFRINPSSDLLGKILTKVEEAKFSKDWKKDKGQFIPYPATWLNRKGWLDEYIQEKDWQD